MTNQYNNYYVQKTTTRRGEVIQKTTRRLDFVFRNVFTSITRKTFREPKTVARSIENVFVSKRDPRRNLGKLNVFQTAASTRKTRPRKTLQNSFRPNWRRPHNSTVGTSHEYAGQARVKIRRSWTSGGGEGDEEKAPS